MFVSTMFRQKFATQLLASFCMASPLASLDSPGRDGPAATRNGLCSDGTKMSTRSSGQGSCLRLKEGKKCSASSSKTHREVSVVWLACRFTDILYHKTSHFLA